MRLGRWPWSLGSGPSEQTITSIWFSGSVCAAIDGRHRENSVCRRCHVGIITLTTGSAIQSTSSAQPLSAEYSARGPFASKMWSDPWASDETETISRYSPLRPSDVVTLIVMGLPALRSMCVCVLPPIGTIGMCTHSNHRIPEAGGATPDEHPGRQCGNDIGHTISDVRHRIHIEGDAVCPAVDHGDNSGAYS